MPSIFDHNDDITDTGSFPMSIFETGVPVFRLREGLVFEGSAQDGQGQPQSHMPMPGVRCPRCAERGIEQWVLPGKHCPRCNQPC